MREDILGILKNAIEHGGNPERIAQSLINSGYPSAEVQQALTYVNDLIPQALNSPQQQSSQSQQNQARIMPQIPTPTANSSTQTFSSHQILQTPNPPQQFIKPLPSTKRNPLGNGKIILLIGVLLILIGSLILVIIFKDKILDLIS